MKRPRHRAATIGEEALPELPFPPGDTANLACAMPHAPSVQHTLCIDRAEADSFTEEDLIITIISDGLPQGDITVSRRDLLSALGVGTVPALPHDEPDDGIPEPVAYAPVPAGRPLQHGGEPLVWGS